MLKLNKKQFFQAGLIAPVLAAPPAATQTIGLSAPGGFTTLGQMSVGSIIGGGISLVLIVVTVVFFFILVIGGLKWITSGGDEKKVAAARAQITNALIGLAIVFASWAIISLIGTLTGFSLTNLTIKKIGT